MNTSKKQIVVPVDVASDSTLAISIAKQIARRGDEIILVHVVPLLDTSGVLLPKAISVDSIAHEIRTGAERRLAALASDAGKGTNVAVHGVVLDGNPGQEIAAVAAQPDTRLIVMETAGRGAASRAMLGSVADHVARSSPVPVLLARHSAGGFDEALGFKRIVVPVDTSERSRLALAVATDLAMRLDAPIHLYAVTSLDRYAYLYGPAYSLAAIDEFEIETSRQLQAALNTAESELAGHGLTITSTLLSGEIGPAIEEQLIPGDLVVMASHGRSGVRRWLLGSVTEHLVRHGSAPVVIVPSHTEPAPEES